MLRKISVTLLIAVVAITFATSAHADLNLPRPITPDGVLVTEAN